MEVLRRERAVSRVDWCATFTYAIPFIYVIALIPLARRTGPADFDQFRVFHELQYWNANLFGLAKQWTPVMCAGLSLAGEPQVPFASLTMLLSYALGPSMGIMAGVFIYLGVGWLGAYLYAGLCNEDTQLRKLAASLYIGNGFFIVRLAHGHLDFIPFLALPLVLWTIHRASDPQDPLLTGPVRVLATMLLGASFAMATDGSPVTIIHWIFWIGVYSCALCWQRRSAWPLVVFVSACCVAILLDAGYSWPMLNAQSDFPRRTPDTFTGPWSLPWFMLIPMRGKLFPANGTGIELSVFIGPWLAWLIWRNRHLLAKQIPQEMQRPLLIVSLVSIWLGMGSLHAASVPVWLSPFDWLRPFPGFRSMNCTGRFWGFLALPLSLLAALALWRYVRTETHTRRRTLLLCAALLTEVVFQGQSLISAWWGRPAFREPAFQRTFNGTPVEIDRVINPGTREVPRHQGELVSPVREVVNCYDMDDFTHAPVTVGSAVIKDIHVAADHDLPASSLHAGFVSWNRIRIETSAATPVRLTLNQAFHTGWTSSACSVSRGSEGNLVVSCPEGALRSGRVDLVFFDRVSELGTRVSLLATSLFLCVAFALVLMARLPRRLVQHWRAAEYSVKSTR